METLGCILIVLLIIRELYYFFNIDKFFDKNYKKSNCKYGCKCDEEENSVR